MMHIIKLLQHFKGYNLYNKLSLSSQNTSCLYVDEEALFSYAL